MAIIKNGISKIKGKDIRVKVFGYEDTDDNFVIEDTWINATDLINIGVLHAVQEKSE